MIFTDLGGGEQKIKITNPLSSRGKAVWPVNGQEIMQENTQLIVDKQKK